MFNNDLESLKIDDKKLLKFQEWCIKNKVDYLVIIEKLIDSCLENNQVILNSIIYQKEEVNFEDKISILINKSLQPILDRIEKLESQLTPTNDSFSSQHNLNTLSPQIPVNISQEEISKRVYLPRQEVWQRLKKTEYIKYSGYDSFLKAKGDQLIEYGIFFDEDKKRISLGMKQLQEHPWDSLEASLEVGTKVNGRIVNVADYGAFLEIKPGVEGLIHVSEMSWSQHLRNPQEFLSINDTVDAVILTIDREERKMSLGIKQLTEDPWTKEEVKTKYASGQRHTGTVRNLTNYGLFLELEEGIDGLVHISDLSWTRKFKHPSEFIKVNEKLEVQVLELDTEQRRLALSHKHMEENPWDTFETIFTPNSVHKGTLVNKNDKGANIELPYGVQGFASTKHLTLEETGKTAEVGNNIDFKVVEFSKDEQRIILSHVATYRSGKEETAAPAKKAKAPKAEASEETTSKSKDMKKSKDLETTSSLGENSALSQLKDDMKDGDSK